MKSKSEFRHFRDYESMSKVCADHIIQRLNSKDQFKIGIATGSSPELLYKLLGNHLNAHPELRSKIEIVQLDEWYGLPKSHPSSCHYYINEMIIRPWQLGPEQCLLLNGDKEQVRQLIKMHESLEKYPLDLCILGFGKNGHLALNEPGSLPSSTCRVVKLTEDSKSHSMVADIGIEISKGMTIGLDEIMQSKEVILLITGNGKQKAFKKFKKGAAVRHAPASVLHKHKNALFFVDESMIA